MLVSSAVHVLVAVWVSEVLVRVNQHMLFRQEGKSFDSPYF